MWLGLRLRLQPCIAHLLCDLRESVPSVLVCAVVGEWTLRLSGNVCLSNQQHLMLQKPLAGSECLLCTAIVACQCGTSAKVLKFYTDQVSGKSQALNLDLK